MRRIAGLQSSHSKEELQEAINDLRGKLAGLREAHSDSDAEYLATELEIGDDDWTVVSRMRDLEENIDIPKAALNLYNFDPDDDRRAIMNTVDEVGNPSIGSFAEFGKQ